MKIEIRAPKGRLTKVQRAKVRRSLDLAASRLGDKRARVLVRIQNGGLPTAPKDMLCRIDLFVRSRKLRVDEIDSELLVAVRRAVSRACRAVARALEMQQHVYGGPPLSRRPTR
jgi:hypothetical protein